jgi:hypothetical protein
MGVKRTPNTVTPIMPLKTAVPSERRISGPPAVSQTRELNYKPLDSPAVMRADTAISPGATRLIPSPG